MDDRLFEGVRVHDSSEWYYGHRMDDGRYAMIDEGEVEIHDDDRTVIRMEYNPNVDPLDSDLEVVATTRNSKYVLTRDKEGYEFDVSVLKKKRRYPLRNGGNQLENEIMCFGPNQTVVLAQSSGALVFVEYTDTPRMKINGKYKLPSGMKVQSMSSDEKDRIFLKGAFENGQRGVWMVTVDDNYKKSNIVKIFDLGPSLLDETPPIIEYASPKMICATIEDVFYLYDLIAMKVLFQREINKHIEEGMAVSPDGRMLFRASRAHIYITRLFLGQSSEYAAIDLAINTLEGPHKVLWTDDEEIALKLYTPSDSLKILQLEGINGSINSIKMIDNRLDIEYSGMHLDVIFDPAVIPVPILEVKKTIGWARIMSNNTFENHLIWPAPGLLIDPSHAPLIIKAAIDSGFPSTIISLAAWANNITQPDPEKSFSKAKEKYFRQLVQAIVRELR